MTRAFLLFGFCALGLAQTPAAAPPPAASPAPADWRFAHPDADMKIGINVQALLSSKAISQALQQGMAQSGAQGQDNSAQIQMALGILRTIDRVSISAHQRGPNDMDVLAEVTGSFDPNFIAGMFPSTGKSQVKVVGPHTLLIGEGDSFTAALDRMNVASHAAKASEMEQSDIWLEASAAMIAQQSGQQNPMLANVKALALGLTFSDSPVVNLALTTLDDAAAGSLLTTFQAMLPLLTSSPQSASMAKNLKLSQDGSTVRMHMIVPPEMMAMLQQQAMAASKGGLPSQFAPLMGGFGLGGGSNRAPAQPAATEPPPQNGGTIKIYGLDDGPKEIPIQK